MKDPDHGMVRGLHHLEDMENHLKRGNLHLLNPVRDMVSLDQLTWPTLKGKTKNGMNPKTGMRMVWMNPTSMLVF